MSTFVEAIDGAGLVDMAIRIEVVDQEGEPIANARIHMFAKLDEDHASDSISGITNAAGILEGICMGFPATGNFPFVIFIATLECEEIHETTITREGLDITLILGAGEETLESKRMHHDE